MLPLILLSSLLALTSASCPSGLSSVAIVHRHGLRTPSGTYKNDPYADFKWPTGYNAQTLKGSQQLYFHGQRLRKRYDSLVKNGGWYSALNINVQSSVRETAIISGNRFMAGFLPPLNVSENPLPIWWQAVAVNPIPANVDNKILSTAVCPAYDQLFKDYIANPPARIQAFLDRNSNLYENLSVLTGQKIATITDVFNIYSILLLEKANDLTIADWAEDFLVQVEPLVALYFALFTETEFMQKAKYAALFTEILQRFEGFVSGKETRQIFEYAGHDYTVVGLARLLGVYDQIPPIQAFGATISLELCGCSNTIEAYYWAAGDTEVPQQLWLGKCPGPCTLENFRKAYSYFIIEPATVDEYNRVCEL